MLFCVGIPLLACGLFLYFVIKRIFRAIDDDHEQGNEDKTQQLNEGLL